MGRKKSEKPRKSTKHNSKAYREKIKSDPVKREEFLEKERQRKRIAWQGKKGDPQFMQKNRERVNRNHRKKIEQQKQSLNTSQDGNSSSGSLNDKIGIIGEYKCPGTVGKAIKKIEKRLPLKHVNKVAVIDHLFFKMHPELPRPSTTSKSVRPPSNLTEIVQSFYRLPDISQVSPGKNSVVKVTDANGNIVEEQAQVLLYTIREAHAEFKKENPNLTISLTTFYNMKPQNVLLTGKLKHIGCLCKNCTNAKLLYKSIEPLSAQKFENVDDMVQKFSCDADCDGLSCDMCQMVFEDLPMLLPKDDDGKKIFVKEWRAGGPRMRMTLTTQEYSLSQVKEILPEFFLKHKRHMKIKNVNAAYFRTSINESTEEHIVVEMDFAEKYDCKEQDEVQSAFFEHCAVNIFTVVVWAGEKKFCKIFVTDETNSGKYTVGHMLKRLFVQLKFTDLPRVKTARVFTDGCYSQFKNRWTQGSIVNLEHFSGVSVEWNFFAPGHGKGAVDAVGGTAKRLVFRKVLSKTTEVQNAKQFHDCMTQHCEGIQSTLVEKDDIKDFEDSVKPFWDQIPPMTGIASFFHFTRGDGGVLNAKQTYQSGTQVTFRVSPEPPAAPTRRVQACRAQPQAPTQRSQPQTLATLPAAQAQRAQKRGAQPPAPASSSGPRRVTRQSNKTCK